MELTKQQEEFKAECKRRWRCSPEQITEMITPTKPEDMNNNKKIRTNITINPRLLAMVKRHGINLSDLMDKLLMKKVGMDTNIQEIVRKKLEENFSCCDICEQQKGIKELICYGGINDPDMTMTICKKCEQDDKERFENKINVTAEEKMKQLTPLWTKMEIGKL